MNLLAALKNKTLTSSLLLFAALPSATAASTIVLPVDGSFVSSGFGERIHPITGQPDFHAGVDLAVPMNTKVHAIDSGKVIQSGWRGLLGNAVEILHPDGDSSIYGHLSHIYVSQGQKVSADQLIGLVGSTGSSTGPHLHLTIKRQGRYLDPIAVLKKAPNAKSIAIASVAPTMSKLSKSKIQRAIAVVKRKPSATEIATAQQKYENLAKEASLFKELYEEGAVSRNAAQAKQLAAADAQRDLQRLRSAS